MPTSTENDKAKPKEENKEVEIKQENGVTSKDRAAQTAEYEKMRKSLKELINKKRTLDKNLNSLEEEIYRTEGSYLEDTQNGNAVRGFDNYMKSNPNKRRMTFTNQDRMFSLSSAVFLKSLEEEGGEYTKPRSGSMVKRK
ncbi:hypothetical protein TRVA0_041S00738 [Trichomonascus vanleenenianus]|uniref:Eaf6p n=1 Tax=Trichomonascus vanleenenianus TaxID=2268995 RepID=UPI003ECA9DBE